MVWFLRWCANGLMFFLRARWHRCEDVSIQADLDLVADDTPGGNSKKRMPLELTDGRKRVVAMRHHSCPQLPSSMAPGTQGKAIRMQSLFRISLLSYHRRPHRLPLHALDKQV